MIWKQNTPDEVIYTGDWSDGRAHGFGSLKSSKAGGFLYKGKFHGHKKHGFGIQTWDNFIVREYKGMWQDDEPEGLGRL